MRGVWVSGEPVLSGGRGQTEWQTAIAEALVDDVHRPALTFVVSSLRRRGHVFDLDNLIHPVLMVLEEPIDSVEARLFVGDEPGVLIDDRDVAPPPEHALRCLYVAAHSEANERARTGISDIADDPVYAEHEGIGLALEFDRSDIPIRRGWFGPTEAVIDDLSPWLGHYTARSLVADHRIRDLRIRRGVDPSRRGVKITVWYVPDAEISLSPTAAERIATAQDQ